MRYRLIDILRGTRTVSYYKHFCNKRFSADELQTLQKYKLAKFLLTIRQKNQFYSDLLKRIEASQIKSAPEDVLRSMPPADKSFITQNMDRIFSPVQGRKFQAKHTGGSTGQPFHYYIDLEAVSESWAYILWCWHKYAGYELGDPYLTVAGSSLGAQGATD